MSRDARNDREAGEDLQITKTARGASRGRDELLAAAEALLAAKDNQMETVTEWRALRRAVKKARKH
jgi:hypothetical protein